ncbi:BTAD domain-containing putative transcriptional regulator [Streptomyces sp. H10-C2]|uniref:AfsR/SARP family transcriptional regulator n=1 Tax=unclassified Streptomyces TaxID=2593676 RepID=UPI0024BBE232|nr:MULTISPECIES: AfsR/SARP family transcriptional regulator [unclassified Streptomyces]MDJ0343643.1 BTAD domain-containing putative transcriptional regulator [Streptomyces sp. PH10-H1]MDJ0373109.1 BTAD domain-containing putative transcriptional regulator [Streptomyces sp. H10-C2]
MRFAILGSVEVSADGRPLPALAPRHRAVLAYLLLRAGTVVSNGLLIEAMWGGTPPRTARTQIQASVSAIRRALRDIGAADMLSTRAPGYVMSPEPGQLDLQRFTEEVSTALAQAAGDPVAAAHRIRTALTLWRGPALADVTADFVPGARERLDEQRLSAYERLVDMELALGRHDDLIAELRAELQTHPLRERLRGQLMLALYRGGRQADALQVARTFRTQLADEQGLDPGSAFLALQDAILRNDPALDRPSPHVPPSPSAPPPPSSPPKAVEPVRRRLSFLPYDVPDFTGRETELTRLTSALSETGGVWTVDGMAGVGKTVLAVHVAHRLADRFPDGQFFVDLHGFTPGREPLASSTALETLLGALDVPIDRIPTDTEQRAGLWRAELSGRRVLIVLDNAATVDQLRPLLPGGSGSAVLATSRRRLTDLDGAQLLSVDVLPGVDAVALFTGVVGRRAVDEPDAVGEVLALCGFLPLAVRIAAARLRDRPQWTVAYLAGRLREQRRRPAELSTADRGVATAFAVSYRHLDPDQQRLFRLLGLHPGPDVDAYAAAALTGIPVDGAERLLEDLLDAHLLLQHTPGRFTFHDLLRDHARTTALDEETADARQAALTRLFDHYRYTAAVAANLLFPFEKQRRPNVPPPTASSVVLADPASAEAWLEADLPNVLAAAAEPGRPDYTGQLSEILWRYLDVHGLCCAALTLHTQALRAAESRADPAGQADALRHLGVVHLRLSDFRQALHDLQQALDLDRAGTDRSAEARTMNNLGVVHERLGDYRQALSHYRQALIISLPHPPGWSEAEGPTSVRGAGS